MEMMMKEAGLRLQVEWIPFVAGFVVTGVAYFGTFLVLTNVLGL
jgi:hypothetical protein